MNYGLIIAHRYPSADPTHYTVIQEEGQEPELTFWNEVALGPRPSEDQFRSWWLDAEKWQKLGQLRRAINADYSKMLFPEGSQTELEKDEIIEKKGARRAGATVNFGAGQEVVSGIIDNMRTKKNQKFQELNAVVVQVGETLEDAVARVRALKW